MDYRKETHFIVAYDEEQNMRGKWDILTNQYIGVKGNPIKSIPAAFNNGHIDQMNENFKYIFELIKYRCTQYPFTEARGKRLEEIISVGLQVRGYWDTWANLLDYSDIKLDKECVKFLNDNYRGIYCSDGLNAYRYYKNHKNLLNKCGNQVDWALKVLEYVDNDIPTDFVEGMIIRGIHEKVYYTINAYNSTASNFADIINNWYYKVKAMGDKVEVKHNILSNYRILQFLYNEYMQEHYDEKLTQYNNKSWLYYENENYIIKPLLTRKEFHDEATAQNNCVERMYMEQVAKEFTHVVAVRRKQSPEQSYITCEVDDSGRIIQFLLKNNRSIYEPSDIQLKAEYQQYLQSQDIE